MEYIIEKLKKYKAIAILITIILILFRLVLYYAAKSKELYLEYDYMYSIINYVIILAALLIYIGNKKVRWAYCIILIILAGINTTILNFTTVNGAYANVLGGLEGTWTDKNNKESTLTFDRGQITYKTGTQIYWYSSSLADEQGNYGTILYGANDTPSLFLLKNDDNTITVGYADIKNDKKSVYGK